MIQEVLQNKGLQSTGRRIGALLCLSVLLLSSRPIFGSDALGDFSAWFKQYRRGAIELYQPSSVPLMDEGEGTIRYFKKDHVQEMDALLTALAEQNDLRSTKLLVEAASFRFDRRPDMEVKRYFRNQPWVLRTHAVEALKKITDRPSLDWLRDLCLNSRSGWEAPFRRMLVASVFSEGRADDDTLLLIQLLDDPEPLVRTKALESLAHAGGRVELNAAAALLDDPVPSVRVAAIEAAGEILSKNRALISSEADRLLSLLVPYLDDPDWRVREAVLGMLERFRSVDSIPILIDFMEKTFSHSETGRERMLQRAAEVLRSLTGAPITNPEPLQWKKWWSENQNGFKLSPAPPKNLESFQIDSPSFFDIPVSSDRVYFILDISGSMGNPCSASQASSVPVETKLDLARRELSNTLASLDPSVRFNLILFNDEVRIFSDEPLAATEETRKNAEQFFESLQAEGDTNLFDALSVALEIQDMGMADSLGTQNRLDTIFLLSDGVPTKGFVIDPDEILKIITQANRLPKIKINTVYLGSDSNPFMRDLATQNFGRYIQINM